MCGIIGYTGRKQAASILLDGLSTLEYRGYDSAGIGVVTPDGRTRLDKKAGKLANLISSLNGASPEGTTGIGHTRWATHGGPTDSNAHPHTGCGGEVVAVHNGIVENYRELKSDLESGGHKFLSQTDSECIPHLIEDFLKCGFSLEEATRMAAGKLRGANATAVFSTREPDRIVAFRLGNAGGIIVGRTEDGGLLSSDLSALLPHTRDVIYLSGGEMASIGPEGTTFNTIDGSLIDKKVTRIPFDAQSAEKGTYQHFMHKEIHDQPESVISTLRGRVSFEEGTVHLPELNLTDQDIAGIQRVVFIGMGTSLHAAMLGRYWMENLARIPCEYDNSSEFRYRNPVLGRETLVVSVSQSGETADTLAAMELVARRGARQITLSNYAGTQATRIAETTVLLRAGLEVGVAASKTFVCSLVALLLLAADIGARRGVLDQAAMRRILDDIARLPEMLGSLLTDEDHYLRLARKYGRRSDFLFLGRGAGFPMAMEGALKLKEISYIHAEGYAAGEMKHGPISLIDEDMPVVAIAPMDGLKDKMMSNIDEVSARGGQVIAVITEGDSEIADGVDDAIEIPAASDLVNPILVSIPLQLLAYYIAVRKGCDVDQPRNLAKTVTVE